MLGSIQDQNQKIAKFKEVATGLGYDPAQVESFSKLIEMGEANKLDQEQKARSQEMDDYRQRLIMQKEVDREFATDQTDSIDAYVDLIESGEITDYSKIPAEVRSEVVRRAKERSVTVKNKDLEQDVKSLESSVEELKKLAKEAGVLNKLNPFSSAHQRFNLVKNLLSQSIAKLYEGGRLSDADKLFYQQQVVQISPYGPDKPKEEILDTLKNEVLKKIGFSGEGKSDDGLGANPKSAEMKQKLKQQGFSDQQIEEYLKAKGL